MKIHQLPLGARFEYEGVVYVKSGPMMGTGPEGQRLIPKYVMLNPLDGVPQAAPPPAEGMVSKAQVLAALADYHARCESLVPEAQHLELTAAREAFIQALK